MLYRNSLVVEPNYRFSFILPSKIGRPKNRKRSHQKGRANNSMVTATKVVNKEIAKLIVEISQRMPQKSQIQKS